MIKELALQYNYIAIICKKYNNFLDFIDMATKEIDFSKTLSEHDRFFENREYILKNFQKGLNKKETIALIDVERYDNYTEFRFYCRNYSDYNDYPDWNMYKFIDYNILKRKEKLEKLKQICNN